MGRFAAEIREAFARDLRKRDGPDAMWADLGSEAPRVVPRLEIRGPGLVDQPLEPGVGAELAVLYAGDLESAPEVEGDDISPCR